MSQTTPGILKFALRLVVAEGRGQKHSERHTTPIAFCVCEKLRTHLLELTGKAGFRALVVRALALATREAPSLRAVRVNPDGSLRMPADIDSRADAARIGDGGVVLIAKLLGLLIAFVGQNLTLRIVSEVWPKLPIRNFDIAEDQRYEKETAARRP